MRGSAGTVTTLLLALSTACGGDTQEDAPARSGTPAATAQPNAELTEVEMEQGIGPIRDLDLGPIDEALASEGEAHYTLLCSACHKFDDRYVGPELGKVLERRRPEFVMNMMLNANEMVQRHPTVRELLAEYFTPMAQQNLTEEQARAVLEYIRTQQVQ